MRFSVIIPLYNKAPYIRKALESVFSQTFRDYELVIVDDGSTDSSLTVAQSVIEGCDIPVRLIPQPNTGVSTARNNGVVVSRGDYLCFLDADDWWEPTFLEKIDGLVRDYTDAGLYGTNYYYVKNGQRKICVTTADTGYINYCKSYADSLKMPIWTGAACIPKTVFEEMAGFKSQLTLGEDFDLWIRIALKYKVAFLDEPCACYNQDSDAAWRLVSKLHAPSSHMLWNLDYLLDEEKTNTDYKRLIDGLRTNGLLSYYLSRQYREAAKSELAKVDWENQPKSIRRLYQLPLFMLIMRQFILKCGSAFKQWIIKHI